MHQTWLYRARMLDHAHHTEGWAATRRTDIDEMALACGPDNRLVEKGWTTRKNARGDTEWYRRRIWTKGSHESKLSIVPRSFSPPDEEPGAA
jgi:hypothetical protein